MSRTAFAASWRTASGACGTAWLHSAVQYARADAIEQLAAALQPGETGRWTVHALDDDGGLDYAVARGEMTREVA